MRKPKLNTCFKCKYCNLQTKCCDLFGTEIKFEESLPACSSFIEKEEQIQAPKKKVFPNQLKGRAKVIAYREARQAKKKRKRYTIKDYQMDVVRFIRVLMPNTKRVGRKNSFDGIHEYVGLQVENKIYLYNGSFKFLNKEGRKILHIYKDIPLNAPDFLIEKYNNLKNK